MILIAVEAVSFISLSRLTRNSSVLTLTYEMLDQLDQVLLHLQNAETGQRGYLITGQESYLEPYHAALSDIDEDLKRLQALMKDHPDPGRGRRVSSLRPLIAEKLAELEETIRMRRRQGFDAAQQLVETDRGKRVMDQIRGVIGEMRTEETRLLHQRNAQVQTIARFTLGIILTGSVLGLTLLVFAGIIIKHDLRNREKAERDRERLEASLRRSEKMSAMGALVAGVAHEVRNPLFAMSSTLDAMEARFAGQEDYQHRYMRVLRTQLKHLQKLMQQLLDYGKPPNPQFECCNLGGVLAEVIENVRPLAAPARIEILSCLSEGLPPVRMVRDQLVRIFQNLVENAVQHSPAGGKVEVTAAKVQRDGRVWLDCAISDSGPGFEPESLALVFEPFFSMRNGGTGLGLSIVQRIAEEYGGEVCAGNRTGGGAVITVRLPLTEGGSDGEK